MCEAQGAPALKGAVVKAETHAALDSKGETLRARIIEKRELSRAVCAMI